MRATISNYSNVSKSCAQIELCTIQFTTIRRQSIVKSILIFCNDWWRSKKSSYNQINFEVQLTLHKVVDFSKYLLKARFVSTSWSHRCKNLKNLKTHNRAMTLFLNKLRDFVKYIVCRNDSHVIIRISQQKNFEKIEVEIVIDNINQKKQRWTASNQTGWDSDSPNLSTSRSLQCDFHWHLVDILFYSGSVITNNLCWKRSTS